MGRRGGSRRFTELAARLERTRVSGHAVALAYVASGLFGVAVAVLSDQPVHRLWGWSAAISYSCAALTILAADPLAGRPGRRVAVTAAVAVAVTGALLVPLCLLAATGRGMPEVWVVTHSAESLAAHGRPYQSAARLGSDVYGYDPYLPGMTIFGVPRALFGSSLATDPRLWDALAFVATFTAALRVSGDTGMGGTRRAVRSAALLSSSPVVAFPLAVSGNDLPVIGLVCLGLALASSPGPRRPLRSSGPRRACWPGLAAIAGPVAAGVALGAAATLKATAWPAVPVVAVLFAVRDGRAAAAWFTGTAAAMLIAVVGPFLLIQPADLVANTIGFPLGLTRAHSPATSPLPGHLLAATGSLGHLAVIALLAATAAALGIALAVRPPRTSVTAAGYLALTLTALFALAPATRWGYFVYPAIIGCWAWQSALRLK